MNSDLMSHLRVQTARYLLEGIASLPLSAAVRQGIPRELVARLQRMTFGELQDFAEHYAARMTVDVSLDALHSEAERQEHQQLLIRDLLFAGASYPQLESWFGFSAKQTQKLRYRYSLPHAAGDCFPVAAVDEENVRRVYNEHWQRWQDDELCEARTMLHTSKATGYSIAQIQRLMIPRKRVNKWI